MQGNLENREKTKLAFKERTRSLLRLFRHHATSSHKATIRWVMTRVRIEESIVYRIVPGGRINTPCMHEATVNCDQLELMSACVPMATNRRNTCNDNHDAWLSRELESRRVGLVPNARTKIVDQPVETMSFISRTHIQNRSFAAV